MTGRYYDGTSAYKIEQYEIYTQQAEHKQEAKRKKRSAQSVIVRKKLVAAVCGVFVVAVLFLYLNVVLMQTSAQFAAVTRELDDMKMRNAELAFDVASGVDLAVVEAKAKNEYGMQRPESHQNVYVDVKQSDYAEAFTATQTRPGIVDSMINSLKAFLAYVG
ncbi:MAG: hypothetical protein IKA95_05230 [Clostridia bacterium]|nr:hypothetical protein [Clostridia bacterium]